MINESYVQPRTLFGYKCGEEDNIKKKSQYMVSIYKNPKLRMDNCLDSLCENVFKMGIIDDKIQQRIWHEYFNDFMCYIKTFVDVS